MIFSISNIAWSPHERLQAYDIMASFELGGLEVAPALFFHESEDPFAPSPQQMRLALEEIKLRGLTLVSMQSLLFGVEGAALFGDIKQQATLEAGMIKAINLAGELGIPNLVFGCPKQRHIPADMSDEEAMELALETFRRLGDRASIVGTTIAIEANPPEYGTNFLNRLNEAEVFVEKANHPQILLNLDLGAMKMNGDYTKTPAIIPQIMKMLNHVHVSEPYLEPAPSNPISLATVLAALRLCGYNKGVSIEMKRSGAGLESVTKSLVALKEAITIGQIA